MMENQGVDHETSQHTGVPFYPLLGSLRLQSSGLPLQVARQQRRLTVVGLYRLGVLPFVSGLFTVLWVGTPGTVFLVERVGHSNANRGEAGLLPIQSSRNGTGSTRSLSKSENRRSTPSRWKTVGPDRGATAEWRPQRPTSEHGVNPILVMPFAKKLHSLYVCPPSSG
jgi:hypothetical protein